MITTFGEILLRLTTPNSFRITQTSAFEAVYGGSEANVSASLAHFGHKVQLITRLPENELSEAVLQTLIKYKVEIDNILKGGTRLGVYFLENGAGHRVAKEIYDRAESAMAEIKPGMVDWDKALENTTWFHWSGITPAISQSAADTCLEAIEVAEKKGIRISVDLNFREKLWQYGTQPSEVMPDMLKHCDIIFGGIDAPEKIFGIVPEDKSSTKGELLETDMISIAEQMLKRFPKTQLFSTTLKWIKNADHHQMQGMIFSKKGGELYLASVYDMPKILDKVGTGDAFMAGLIHGMIHFEDDLQEVVNFATAASVLKHYIHGEVNISTISEIEDLIRK
ncbi:MAG: PfkB family carbohydrate kinase [Cytophagales bacterium]